MPAQGPKPCVRVSNRLIRFAFTERCSAAKWYWNLSDYSTRKEC
jgi:hypothetical protein